MLSFVEYRYNYRVIIYDVNSKTTVVVLNLFLKYFCFEYKSSLYMRNLKWKQAIILYIIENIFLNHIKSLSKFKL